MEVRFTIEAQDIRSAFRYMLRAHPENGLQEVLMALTPILFGGLLISLFNRGNPVVTVGAMLVSAAFVIVFLMISERSLPRYAAALPGVMTQHITTIDQRGIGDSTDAGNWFQSWRCIRTIECSNDHIYFFFYFRHKLDYHLIPARAFSSPDDAVKFRDHAMSLWQGATQNSQAA